MNVQKQITKELQKELRAIERYELTHRTAIERSCSIILTLATLFSITGLGHTDDRRQVARRGEVVVQTVPIFSPAEKNETVRMPIKFDGGLRATATTSG